MIRAQVHNVAAGFSLRRATTQPVAEGLKTRRYILPLILAGLLALSACIPAAQPTSSPTSVPTPTPATPAVPTETAAPTAQQVLAQTVAKLDAASSYRFNIAATLNYAFENTTVEWKYQGQGAFSAPASYEWTIEGQADVMLRAISVDGKTSCADTRGIPPPGCSLAWGGPSPGSSPYTAIAYIRNVQQVGDLQTKDLDGKPHYYIIFTPSLSKVAALDTAHSAALGTVSGVSGELWIDIATGLPRREKVVIELSPPSRSKQRVEITLGFFDYGKPVEIRLTGS